MDINLQLKILCIIIKNIDNNDYHNTPSGPPYFWWNACLFY